jgi:hypothetical protein
MEKHLIKLLLVLPLSLVMLNSASAGLIIEDFNGALPADATLHGTASLTGGEIQLTPSLLSQLGGLSFLDQDSGAAIDSWSALFDFRIDQNGNGGADGISLSFSRLGDVGAVGEEGLSSGIAIGFDTWNNGEVSDNHVSLRYDGALLVEVDVTSSFLLQDGVLRNALITMNNGLLELSIAGTPLISHNIAGWSAYSGQFNFGGRTGGARSRQVIDNFEGHTTAAAVPEPATLALFGIGLAGLGFARKKKKSA